MEFGSSGAQELLDAVSRMNSIRNQHVAHQEVPLTSADQTQTCLRDWVRGLDILFSAHVTV